MAQKMSWAAKRETTRVEDMAYFSLVFSVFICPHSRGGQTGISQAAVRGVLMTSRSLLGMITENIGREEGQDC